MKSPGYNNCVEQGIVLRRLVKCNQMGKGNKRRKRNKQRRRTEEERDLVKERILEAFERDAERRAKLFPERPAKLFPELAAKLFAERPAPPADSAPPPILGEGDPPVRAPLKPRPHLRSGAIALPEPESEEFAVVTPKGATAHPGP